MLKGEGNGCICPLTEPRSEAHVIQRAAALPPPATSNNAKDMQEVPQEAAGPPKLLRDLNFTNKILRLHVSLLIQLPGELTCSRPDSSSPQYRPFSDKIQPSVLQSALEVGVPGMFPTSSTKHRTVVWLPAQCMPPHSLALLLMFQTSQLMEGTVRGNLPTASAAELQRVIFLCVDE